MESSDSGRATRRPRSFRQGSCHPYRQAGEAALSTKLVQQALDALSNGTAVPEIPVGEKLAQEDKEDFRDRRAALPVLALDVECEL